MKQLFLALISVLALSACSKEDGWTPEDDVKDFLTKNPYGVVFENGTGGDLFITCDDVSENVIIVKEGKQSGVYHSSKSYITISYSGEGTYWTKKTKGIDLVKDEVIHYSITYPYVSNI